MVNKMIFHDDELDEYLKNKLAVIESTSPRDPESALRGRNDFINETKELHVSIDFLINENTRLSFFRSNPSIITFAAVILLVFGFIFGSLAAEHAAQDSLPDDLLYSVKLTGENIRFIFTRDLETRITLLATYTERRANEATTLALQGQPIPHELPARMDAHLKELFSLATKLNEESRQETLKDIHVYLSDQDRDIANVINELPVNPDPQLIELHEIVRKCKQTAQMTLDKVDKFGNPKWIPPITITSTLTTKNTSTPTGTPGDKATPTKSPGVYQPGPCDASDTCTTPADANSPSPKDVTPKPDVNEGVRPSPDQGKDYQKPSATPIPGENAKTKQPQDLDSSGGNKNGKDGNNEQGGKP